MIDPLALVVIVMVPWCVNITIPSLLQRKNSLYSLLDSLFDTRTLVIVKVEDACLIVFGHHHKRMDSTETKYSKSPSYGSCGKSISRLASTPCTHSSKETSTW
jgi:hypothetical protein